MNTLVPLALADVAAILYCNAKMSHRISQIYGVWGTLLESWRLLHKVKAHLVATVAMAIGDDWLGRGLVSESSWRFREWVVNTALTARIERTAIEGCRSLTFVVLQQPSVAVGLKNAISALLVKQKD